MTESHSISIWIQGLRDRETDSAREIWERFHKRLMGVASRQLRNSPSRVADGDDVVAEAFATFFRRAEAGEYPDLQDRDGLWHLLYTITERKALNQIRHVRAQKRGAGQVRGDSIFRRSNESQSSGGFERMASVDATPEDIVILRETFTVLLDRLTDDQRKVAQLKMQGFANREISEQVGSSVATIERRLRQIRQAWTREGDNDDE